MKAITHRHRERKKNGMSKKGEITSQQIVILVVLIASFAILLFFLFRLNPGGESDKELCRNSVLLKGKSVFKDSTLLSCKTNYLCLTADGKCDSSDLYKPEIIKVKDADEVYKVLAEEMTDCWWMFGEGKVNYVESEFSKKIHCSICSQIYLDNSLNDFKKIDNEVKQADLYEYLSEKKMSGRGITYLQFLFGTTSELSVRDNAKFGNMPLGENYFVIMGIKNQVGTTSWVLSTAAGVGIAAGGAALYFVGAPLTIPITVLAATAGTVAGGFGGDYIATVIQGESGNDFLRPTIIKTKSNEYESLNCEEVITLS